MIPVLLPIVKYGRPILRQKGKLARPERENLRQLISDMLKTMRLAKGVGLAAQQIGRAIQLTVIDVREAKEMNSEMWIDDQPATINKHMPMILLNPKITPLNAAVSGQEGCLSFPEIYGDVLRPETVDVEALHSDGSAAKFRCNGLLARVVQHETDHLNGILFIDRMTCAAKRQIQPALDALRRQTMLQKTEP